MIKKRMGELAICQKKKTNIEGGGGVEDMEFSGVSHVSKK